MYNNNATRDEASEIDFQYSEVIKFWNTQAKNKFPKQAIIIQDQSEQDITKMACTRYALFHIINWHRINAVWAKVEQLEAIIAWQEYIKDNPNAEEVWASLQSALNQEKQKWNIGWYALAQTHDEIKTAINNWHYIYTWYNTGRVRNNKYEFLDRFTWWHSVAIIWYDDDKQVYIWLNSYWPDNWYFTIDYKLIETFFTRIAIFPTNYSDLINKYKKMRDDKTLELAKKMWITNWENLQEPMTRWQGAIMNTRVLINVLKRIEWGSFDEKLDSLLNE